MSKSVVIEVTRGPVFESRHEGIAAVVQAEQHPVCADIGERRRP